RFSLYDNRSARVFTVTITELTLEDAGIYYCRIDRKIKLDEYTEVKVTVNKAEVFYGIEGGNVKIDCTYQHEYNENGKYLCRTRWIPNNALISSGDPETKGRFSLYDNRSTRVFTVTITELTQKDAGTYYCGIDIKRNVDEYTEVEVTVNKGM
ncbi:CMRF35-like molecule 5, partial [Huso huso]